MKSLEFINSKIKQIKKDLYKLGETKEGTNKDFAKYVLTEELKDYQDVKQDLEILDILKALIIHNIKSVGLESAIRDYKVLVKTGELTQGQLNELLKWLEEQE